MKGAKTLNTTVTTLVKDCTTKGSGLVYGVIVNSHSSGTMQFLDGLTQTGSTKATSVLTVDTAIAPAKYAESVLTSDTTNVADADTVTIGTTVYRFKDTMAQAYDVKRGASAAISLDNLKAAINATGTPGTEYYAGTLVHPSVIATTNTDTTQKIVSRVIGTANNTKATTETSSHLSWEDTTLGGGTGLSVAGVATATASFVLDTVTYYLTTSLAETHGLTAIPNQILWVTSDAVALDNVKSAINASGTEGTDYATGTVIHPTLKATTNTNTQQTFEAIADETAGNGIVTTETMTGCSFNATTTTGGTNYSIPKGGTYTFASGSQVISFPEPMEFYTGIYYFTNGTTQNVTVLYS